jgi:hypothetical protein
MILLLSFILATELIDLEMTPKERKKAGIHLLSDKQKSSLQTWIDNHYEKRATPLDLGESAEKPKVSSVEYNELGTFVNLCDGSKWQISPKDAPIAQGWINPDVEIILHASGDEGYPKRLTNTLSKSSVRAKTVAN